MNAPYVVSEISRSSPDMADDAFARFKADIKERGQLVPIVLLGDQIVDGRKRFRACQELGIQPHVVRLNGGQSAEGAARSLNLLRTHYTHGQITMYAAKLATRPRGAKTSSANSHMMTEEQARQAFGVGQGTVGMAKKVLRDGHPNTIAAVESGKITLGAATKIATAPKAEQPAKVAKAVDGARGPTRRQPTGGGFARREKVKPAAQRFARALVGLTTTLEVMSDALDGDLSAYLSDLKRARATLARIIHTIEES